MAATHHAVQISSPSPLGYSPLGAFNVHACFQVHARKSSQSPSSGLASKDRKGTARMGTEPVPGTCSTRCSTGECSVNLCLSHQ